MKKKFVITIDTEGDNLWSWKNGDTVKTECVNYLPRFQYLANEYGFKPTWLANYEIIMNDDFIDFIKKQISLDSAELGMHLHAWNNPPIIDILKGENGQPYLIEYPVDIMDEKIDFLTKLIQRRTNTRPISHRAGRWAMNKDYFRLLAKHGYKIDCSVTPYVNWTNSMGGSKGFGGVDYSHFPHSPYYDSSGILEVPVSIRKVRKFIRPDSLSPRNILSAIKNTIIPKAIWIRPTANNTNQMLYLVDYLLDSDAEYIMFMLHSSEMMPGGSPTFKDKESIERLYKSLYILFSYIENKCEGIMLKDMLKYY